MQCQGIILLSAALLVTRRINEALCLSACDAVPLRLQSSEDSSAVQLGTGHCRIEIVAATGRSSSGINRHDHRWAEKCCCSKKHCTGMGCAEQVVWKLLTQEMASL